MQRRFATFVGVDLGGARGKTTAVAQLVVGPQDRAQVRWISTRHAGAPWVDDTLLGYLAGLGDDVVLAIGAPLTSPACGRCVLPACPGVNDCVDPAVVWLRSTGRAMTEDTELADSVASGQSGQERVSTSGGERPRVRIAPYAHRATELVVCYERGLLPASQIGHANGQVAARAAHLRRRLLRAGFALHQNLLEVSPAATIAALFDRRRARGYKRDADPWQTRALLVESLTDLEFAPASRMAREDALRNDHCFEALIAAYTAYLWAKEGWSLPEPAQPFVDDGWIWVPPPRR
jgi:Protein of unknown function (DUF429)